MRKCFKIHCINLMIWVAFFAVVFFRYDYTRSVKGFLALMVWCAIVFVISMIVLSIFQRFSFSRKTSILCTLALVVTDQAIKLPLYFSPVEISVSIIPGILKIFVIVNRYQTLVLQILGVFVSPYVVAICKLALLPFFSLFLLFLTKSRNRFSFKSTTGYAGIVLISAAIISTSLDSLFFGGAPDYFYLIPLYSSTDLKDIFAFLGASCLLSIISTRRAEEQ